MELERITKRLIDTLKPGDKITDSEIRGFRARCWDSGRVSFEYRYRNGRGERRSLALGVYGDITPEQARSGAQKAAGAVADGRDPAGEREHTRAKTENTVNRVLDAFVAEYVNKNIKRPKDVTSMFDRLVRPAIGAMSIYELARSDVVKMLRHIAKDTPVQANRTLAFLRKAFNWYAIEDDRFKTPIVIGMTPHKERSRDRVLDDDEIRDVIVAADVLSTGRDSECPAFYGDVIRALLFSAQRISNVTRAHSREFNAQQDEWVIDIKDAKRGGRGRRHLVPVTDDLHALLIGDGSKGYRFATASGEAFDNYGRAKLRHDRKIAEQRKARGAVPMPHWTYHDLRRTSRTRIGKYISRDHAKRVVGHVIPGIDRVYDLYEYAAEKRQGLEQLAAEYKRILSPTTPPDNVVSLKNRRRSSSPRAPLGRVAG